MTAPSIPTLEIAGPAGRRVIVAPRSPDDRVGELADALGLDPGAAAVDGRESPARDPRPRRPRPRQPARARRCRGDRARDQRRRRVVTVLCDAGPAPALGRARPRAPRRRALPDGGGR